MSMIEIRDMLSFLIKLTSCQCQHNLRFPFASLFMSVPDSFLFLSEMWDNFYVMPVQGEYHEDVH